MCFNAVKQNKKESALFYRRLGSVQAVRPMGGVEI